MSAYKYKNDIKSRFMTSSSSSASKSSDSVSNSSRESVGSVDQSTHDKISRMSVGCQPNSPNGSAASCVTPYPRSDNSSLMGSSNYMASSDANSLSPPSSGSPPLLDMSTRETKGSADGQQQHPAPVSLSASAVVTSGSSTTETIPAFALHPGGMHYIPIVMHTYALSRHLNEHDRANANASGPCHLISIPVSFGGPVINVDSPIAVATANNNPQHPPPGRSHGHGDGQQHRYGNDNNGNDNGNNNSGHDRRRSRDFSHSLSSPFINVTASNPFMTHPNNRNAAFSVIHPSGSCMSA